eukprot:TRINITY_DN416_c0_g1_i2.p1 TRINITY_DN416_c0_g1~~TRINITY_DN416_c0_g1_i2.p1  ORF type:complete len:1058 (+),score=371.63 TRINITY_DN416_c0_g1_i2:70-3243(+)
MFAVAMQTVARKSLLAMMCLVFLICSISFGARRGGNEGDGGLDEEHLALYPYDEALSSFSEQGSPSSEEGDGDEEDDALGDDDEDAEDRAELRKMKTMSYKNESDGDDDEDQEAPAASVDAGSSSEKVVRFQKGDCAIVDVQCVVKIVKDCKIDGCPQQCLDKANSTTPCDYQLEQLVCESEKSFVLADHLKRQLDDAELEKHTQCKKNTTSAAAEASGDAVAEANVAAGKENFDNLDINGDGAVTADELKKFDEDGDGKVTLAEAQKEGGAKKDEEKNDEDDDDDDVQSVKSFDGDDLDNKSTDFDDENDVKEATEASGEEAEARAKTEEVAARAKAEDDEEATDASGEEAEARAKTEEVAARAKAEDDEELSREFEDDDDEKDDDDEAKAEKNEDLSADFGNDADKAGDDQPKAEETEAKEASGEDVEAKDKDTAGKFDALDIDGDGAVSVDELEKRDKDSDGKVTQEELEDAGEASQDFGENGEDESESEDAAMREIAGPDLRDVKELKKMIHAIEEAFKVQENHLQERELVDIIKTYMNGVNDKMQDMITNEGGDVSKKAFDDFVNQMVRAKFYQGDDNADGVLTREETKKSVNEFGVYMTDEEFKEIAGNDEKITFDEFEHWLMGEDAETTADENPEAEAKTDENVLGVLDKDKNGIITTEEIAAADTNGDGAISAKEAQEFADKDGGAEEEKDDDESGQSMSFEDDNGEDQSAAEKTEEKPDAEKKVSSDSEEKKDTEEGADDAPEEKPDADKKLGSDSEEKKDTEEGADNAPEDQSGDFGDESADFEDGEDDAKTADGADAAKDAADDKPAAEDEKDEDQSADFEDGEDDAKTADGADAAKDAADDKPAAEDEKDEDQSGEFGGDEDDDGEKAEEKEEEKAEASPFSNLDKDKNGTISIEEFRDADKNGDYKVSLDEAKALGDNDEVIEDGESDAGSSPDSPVGAETKADTDDDEDKYKPKDTPMCCLCDIVAGKSRRKSFWSNSGTCSQCKKNGGLLESEPLGDDFNVPELEHCRSTRFESERSEVDEKAYQRPCHKKCIEQYADRAKV